MKYRIEITCNPYHSSRLSHANDIILARDGATPVRWTRDDLQFSDLSDAKDGLVSLLRHYYDNSSEWLEHFASKEEIVNSLIEGCDLERSAAEESAAFFTVPGYYAGKNLVMADTDIAFGYDIFGCSIREVAE